MITRCRPVPIALALLVSGCAGTSQIVAPIQYDSGSTPDSFDVLVVRKSSDRYEINGVPYTFDALVEQVKRAKARTVLVNGTSTIADVLCVSILGVETGSSVFFDGSDGKPKAVSFSMDAASTANIARSCRE